MPKRIVQEFRIDEISGVDSPAQEGARVAIMKRAEALVETPPIGKGMGDLADLLTGEEDGHQHGVNVDRYEDKSTFRVTAAIAPDADHSHDHPIARSSDGQYVLGMVAGHTHEIDQESMSRAVLALMTKSEGDETMTDEAHKGANVQPTLEELQAQLTRAHAVVGLTSEERSHFDALPEEARTAFLAKSASDRGNEMKAVAKADPANDPVVYKTADGVALRKSAGEALIEMAKRTDAIAKENADLRAEREQNALEKRAEAEIPHLPGDVKAHAVMLKAIDGIEDDAQRETARKALKVADAAMSAAFKANGHGGQPPPGTADDALDGLAKAQAKEHGGSYEAAYADVLKSAEGRALYAETLNREVK